MLAFRVPPRRPFGPPGARPARPVRAPPGAVRGASAVCSAVSAPSRLRASPPPSAARLRLAGGGARSGRPGLRPASRPAGPVPRRSASSLAPLASACRRGASPVARGLPPPRRRACAAPLSRWSEAAGAVRLARAGPSPCPPPARPPVVGLALLLARRGPLRGSGSGGAPPSGPPLRGGFALAPPRRGAAAAPAGRLLGRSAAPRRFRSAALFSFAQGADRPLRK